MSQQKKRPLALLCSLAFSLSIIWFGVLDIYMMNVEEFQFRFSDFFLPLLGLTVFVAALLFLALWLTRGLVSRILFALVIWATVMTYFQGLFLNWGLVSLLGDNSDLTIDTWKMIVNALLWLITGAAAIFGAIKFEKLPTLKTVAVIALIAVLAMQFSGCFVSLASQTQGEPKDVQSALENARLTTKDMEKVAKGKNIIIFILDRFDVSYYKDIKLKAPNFFEPLTGFTYFSDNISLYSRTYPSACEMITGVDNDWNGRQAYFMKAYQESPFLKDLKANDFKIKIYADHYYVYDSGEALNGVADNLSLSSSKTITDPLALLKNLVALSAYKSLPLALKSVIKIDSTVFSHIVQDNTDYPTYTLDDAAVYKQLTENGLSLDECENAYMFLHLSGCHDPYKMDENGNPVENGSAYNAITGCFNMIYKYIDELKRLDLYKDATIIITGDHPRARDDAAVPTQPRLTSLFVKPSGAENEPLAYSAAQVSQENLIPTLVASSKLTTENTYGRTYFEVPEGETVLRRHKFELYTPDGNYIVTLAVNGNGELFSNWSEESRTNVGNLYK